VSVHHCSTAYSAVIPRCRSASVTWLPWTSHPTAAATGDTRRENLICSTASGEPTPYLPSALARSNSNAHVGPSTHRTRQVGDSHSTTTGIPASSDSTVAQVLAAADRELATADPSPL